MSTTHYPPTVQQGFTGAQPFSKSGSWEPTHRSYFQSYRNENISRLKIKAADKWGDANFSYTPQPDVLYYAKLTDKYFMFPPSQISMLHRARQKEIDDIFLISQRHRDQYKDNSGTLHPLDYFKKSKYMFQCPPEVYMKTPTFCTKYKQPIVYI